MTTTHADPPVDIPDEPQPQPPEWRAPSLYALLVAECQAELDARIKRSTDRIIANVLDRLAHPHPCASCGDLTCADVCAACQEDQAVDRWGISLDLRAAIRQDALTVDAVAGF